MRKYAFFGIPHMGGTYSVFRFLQKGLLEYDIEVSWIGIGIKDAKKLIDERQHEDELSKGYVFMPDNENNAKLGKDFVSEIENKFDGCFVNVLSDQLQMNSIRYMSEAVHKIMIVHNSNIGTYTAARDIYPYIHQVVGVSRRICDDLVNKYKFSRDNCHCIPNAIQIDKFKSNRGTWNGKLRLLSLGRIEEKSKGLFIIPKALEKIQDLNWTLTIAGDGPDRVELERRLSRSMEKVKFVGQIAPEEVPDCFKTHDVFLFPSRYEGFGITLIEALAAGCTPIASLITGVTDDIVLDQDRGLIIPQGNFQALARAIRFMYENPSIRSKMQKKGIAWASDNVAIDKVCYKYFELLQSKIKNQKSSPKAIDSWRIPNGMRPGFRTFLPEPIKSKLREWREKLHTFTVHQYNNN